MYEFKIYKFIKKIKNTIEYYQKKNYNNVDVEKNDDIASIKILKMILLNSTIQTRRAL